MSPWNHLSRMTPAVFDMINAVHGRIGDPMPSIGTDIHAFWADWINRGWFAWETEGYPHSANMRHTQSWWNLRHLPNILFVHFKDLLADPAFEVRRVARHIALGDRAVDGIVKATTFAAMREKRRWRDWPDVCRGGQAGVARRVEQLFLQRHERSLARGSDGKGTGGVRGGKGPCPDA